MTKVLENKIALVTGAGSGIGQAIARIYAASGAKVVVSDIVEKAGKETVSKIIEAGGDAIFVKADTSSARENEALVAQALQHYGALHIACNNAGISGMHAPVGEYQPEDWDRVISVNLSGVFYGSRYQIPAMLTSGGGVIVNMASVMGQVGYRETSAYVASKHGVIGLTRSTALEYAQRNIRVNAVGPGVINTPLISILGDDVVTTLAAMHPVGRLGQPSEVAELVLWLSSDKASFVTGAYYPVDGGYLAQ